MEEYKKILNIFSTDFICAGMISLLYIIIFPKNYSLLVPILLVYSIYTLNMVSKNIKNTKKILSRAEDQIEDIEKYLNELYKERYD